MTTRPMTPDEIRAILREVLREELQAIHAKLDAIARALREERTS